MTGVHETYDRYQRLLAEANGRNKAAVFDALQPAGITTVTVSFDGEGDSGQIQDVIAYTGDLQSPMPAATVSIEEVTWGSDVWHTREDVPLAEAIEGLCYGFLSQEYCGWENNDGAFGDFTLDVAARTIKLEFNARFTSTETFEHDF